MKDLQDGEDEQARGQVRDEHPSRDADEVRLGRERACVVKLVQLVVDPDVRGLVQDALSDQEHRVDERADERHSDQVGREHRNEDQQCAGRQRPGDDREPFVELNADLRRQEDAGAGPSQSERHLDYSASIERPTIVRNASSRLTGPTVADRCSRSATSMISWTRPGPVMMSKEFPSATLWPNEANRSRWFPPFSIETRKVPPICRFASSAVPSKRIWPSSTMYRRSESASASSR